MQLKEFTLIRSVRLKEFTLIRSIRLKEFTFFDRRDAYPNAKFNMVNKENFWEYLE